MSLKTEQDVYDRVRTQIGKLERRMETHLMTPSKTDEDDLRIALEDALAEIGTITERLNTSIQLSTVPSQAHLERPPHMYVLDEATVFDGGTSYELDVNAGPEITKWCRAPNADEDRPTHIGAFEGRLYFYPIPDTEYTIDMQVTMNGEVADTAPASESDPPQVDTVVERVPKELERALASYVTGHWLMDAGQAEVAQRPLQRFETDVRRFEDEPVHQSDATLKYRPLGF